MLVKFTCESEDVAAALADEFEPAEGIDTPGGATRCGRAEAGRGGSGFFICMLRTASLRPRRVDGREEDVGLAPCSSEVAIFSGAAKSSDESDPAGDAGRGGRGADVPSC